MEKDIQTRIDEIERAFGPSLELLGRLLREMLVEVWG